MPKLVDEEPVETRRRAIGDATPDERASVWSILSDPRIYELLQRVAGADHARSTLAREVVRAEPGDRLLDIGCAAADLIVHFSPEVSYLGIDARIRCIEHARRRFSDRGTFLVGHVEALPSSQIGPRDLVLASALLHHLDDAAAGALLEVARSVLVPGGRFVAVDPVVIPNQHPIARALVRLDRGRHVRTVEETEALVRRHFDDVAISLRSGLQRFPYDHIVVDARR